MNMTDRQCLGINNRFKLVVLASQRAHDLSSGAHSTIDNDKSKNTVVALKEILSSKLNNKALFDFAVKRCRSYIDELFSAAHSVSSINDSLPYDTSSDNFLNTNQDSDSDYYESDDASSDDASSDDASSDDASSDDASSDDDLLVDPSFDEFDINSSDDNYE